MDFDSKKDRSVVKWMSVAAIGATIVLLIFAIRAEQWIVPAIKEDFLASDLVNLLGTLVFVALLQERALEVFVSMSRRTVSLRMELDIAEIDEWTTKHEARRDKALETNPKADVSRIQSSINGLRKKLSEKRLELRDYRSRTMRLALSVSVAIGVLISVAGLRTLEHTVSTAGFGDSQLSAFKGADILLMGALLAGGSDGIHKLMSVLTSTLDSYKVLAKKLSGRDTN